jgi:MOSC domain-containing protein YiiM
VRLLSVNVGKPRTVEHQGRRITTGIFKTPVSGPVPVRRLNLDGDGQADLRVHGGEDKAVYVYPAEHYDFWSRELGRDDLGFGFFGENFTTEGLLEDEVCIGDVLRIGSARFEVSQPRTPCFKLAMRIGIEGFEPRFAASGRLGFYLRVLEEGSVAAGNAIERVARGAGGVSVREAHGLRFGASPDPARLRIAAGLRALSSRWREALARALGVLTGVKD